MKGVAAYLLSVLGGNDTPSAKTIKDILGSVGAEAEDDRIELFLSEIKGKDLAEVIASGREKLASVPSGGGVVVAAAPASGDIKNRYQLIRDQDYLSDPVLLADMTYHYDPPNIAMFLNFAIDLVKVDMEKRIQIIKDCYLANQWDRVKTEANELANLFSGDRRLVPFLDTGFIDVLYELLHNKQVQLLAATIIRHITAASNNEDVVKQCIKYSTDVIEGLVSFEDIELQMEAMWLIRTVALRIKDYPEFTTTIEDAVIPVIHFPNKGSSNCSPDMIYLAALTLGAFCQVYPGLNEEKFKYVLDALMVIILQYDMEEDLAYKILPRPCYALAHLCNGRKTMVVETNFDKVIARLIVFIDSEFHGVVNAGLVALASIVRWASDDCIKVMIEKGLLWSLECLLCEKNNDYVLYSCMILSNITARDQVFLQDVIDCNCIESLVGVVQKKIKCNRGKKEAAWAILNAISGAELKHHKKFLKENCAMALWEFLTEISGDLVIFCTFLKVLLSRGVLEVLKVRCNGTLTCGTLADLHNLNNHLTELQVGKFQLDDVDMPKLEKLGDNLVEYEGYHITSSRLGHVVIVLAGCFPCNITIADPALAECFPCNTTIADPADEEL